MPVKTYVLLSHTKPTIEAYQRVNANQRVRLDKRPFDHAYRKITFTTPDGKNRTARLKLNCDTIWQDEQMKADGPNIPANESFTQRETDAVKFVNEILMTNNEVVQTYLESIPQYDLWWKENEKKGNRGYSDEKPLYTLLNKEVEAKTLNAETRRRIKAANKVMELEDLKEAQDLMIKLNGSFFIPPDDLVDIQNALIEYCDDADDAMLDALLKEETTIDEKVTILIGRAINEKIISFDDIADSVAKKKGDGWISVKEISSSHPLEERKRYLAEFLTSIDGQLLRADLEKEVEAIVKKQETKLSNAKK